MIKIKKKWSKITVDFTGVIFQFEHNTLDFLKKTHTYFESDTCKSRKIFHVEAVMINDHEENYQKSMNEVSTNQVVFDMFKYI